MKKKKNLFKAIAFGLFVMAMLLNVSLTVDNGNSRNADLSLGSLKVSLFQKAYAYGGGYICVPAPEYCTIYLGGGDWLVIPGERRHYC